MYGFSFCFLNNSLAIEELVIFWQQFELCCIQPFNSFNSQSSWVFVLELLFVLNVLNNYKIFRRFALVNLFVNDKTFFAESSIECSINGF